MNPRSQLARAELVAPLSGPSYGAYAKAKRRWRKPLAAVIADALANNQAIIARFKLGVRPGDTGNRSHYEKIFYQLCQSTDEQIKALEAFCAVGWRE